MLEVKGLCKSFGALRASDGIDFHVAEGETHALIGPNGAGKTTFISQLAGELRPDAGRIVFGGEDITALSAPRRARKGLARSFQITSVYPEFTAHENVMLAVQARSGHSFRFWRDARREPVLREPARRLLEVETAYGRSQVLFRVNLEVRAAEVVTLLGRNGMGKTTTVKSIMGIAVPKAGEILFDGKALRGLASYRIAQAGLGLVPEGRQVFPNLTVRENLVATARRGGPWTLERVFALFPQLRERRSNYGNQLSGGEQQMLAIARALMTNPRLLILDEATEGLAPLIRHEIYRSIAELKAQGLAILVIDKDVKALCRVADRHYVLEKGRVVWSGSTPELSANRELQSRYLGV